MNHVIYFFAAYPIYFATIFAVAHVLIKHEKKHHIRHIVTIIGGTAVSFGVATFLKEKIAHARPELANALFVPGDIYSFPSGHATFMFALAFMMYSFDRKASIPLFLLAVIVGVSRVLAGVHYWYDIVGGVVVAAIVSFVVVRLCEHFIKRA